MGKIGKLVTVGTTPTLICPADKTRTALTLITIGATQISYESDPILTTSTGIPLPSKGRDGYFLKDGEDPTKAIYGIVTAGTSVMMWIPAFGKVDNNA